MMGKSPYNKGLQASILHCRSPEGLAGGEAIPRGSDRIGTLDRESRAPLEIMEVSDGLGRFRV